MTENMKKFIEAADADPELAKAAEKLESLEDLIALAEKKGFTLTAEDLKPEEPTGELSDDELEDVAGGRLGPNPFRSFLSRFGICMPAASGTAVGNWKPAAGKTMQYGATHTADKGVYFGGISGPVRLGNTDGGYTQKEV